MPSLVVIIIAVFFGVPLVMELVFQYGADEVIRTAVIGMAFWLFKD